MRILFYIYSLPVGGAEMIVTDYLEKLQSRGHEVCLVEDFHTDSFLTQRLLDKSIPVFTLWKGNISSPLGRRQKQAARMLGLHRRFDRILKTWQPDIVHFHGCPDHMDRLSFPRERMFYTFHSELHRNLRILGEGNQARLQTLCNGGLTICALTEDCARECREIFHTDRVVYVPNGVDFSKVRSRTYSRTEIEALFGIPQDRFLVGTLGRLDPVKEHERLLAIFREVWQRRKDAVLLVVGGDCGGRLEKLPALARELGLAQNVVFTGQRQDADAILAALDRFVLTSRTESFSLVSIEAQALGVPCILSDAVPKEVACENCLRLSLSESDSTWAQAILAPPSGTHTGSLGAFDLDAVIDTLEKTYRSRL